MRSWTLLGCVALACTFESSSLVPEGMSGGSTMGAATDPTGTTDAEPTTPGPGTDGTDAGTADTGAGPTGPTSEGPTTTDANGSSSSGEGSEDPCASETTGEPAFVLTDELLVARYFLDEAAEGMMPTLALDVAEEPLDLPLEYTEATMHYVEESGQRGLAFDTAGADDAARIEVTDTKLAGLQGVTSLTIEVVVRLEDAVSAGSRLVHVGHNDSSTVALAASGPDEIEARWNNSVVRTWDYTNFTGAAHVLHLIIDTEAANEAEQFRLVVDGVELAPSIDSSIDPGEPASLPGNAIFALGNRHQDRTIEGVLFYVAIYGTALSDGRVAEHVSRLLTVGDDS